jgi:hypothetical protein
LAIKNIQEEAARVKELENKATIQTSKPKEKDLANKIREVNSQAGNVCCKFGSLAWDGAIETVAKSVEAGGACGCYTSGSRIHSKNRLVQELSKADQAKAENGFTDSLNDGAKNDGPIVPKFQ